MLKKWYAFCIFKDIDPDVVTFELGTECLIWLHKNKTNHSTIQAARSVLSLIIPKKNDTTFGEDEQTKKILRGMFRENPRIPRKVAVYDTNIVIQHMEELPPNNYLTLEELTKKMVTLLCILSTQRSQSIANLYEEHMIRDDARYTFYIPKILKTTTNFFHQDPLEFEAFPLNSKLCIYNCLDEYLGRTRNIRENVMYEDEDKIPIILSYAYPHRPIKSGTLARYVKEFLLESGVDVTVFTCHSTRSASTSKLNNLGLSLKDISKAAGWRGSSTFQRFYKFRVTKNPGFELLKTYSV